MGSFSTFLSRAALLSASSRVTRGPTRTRQRSLPAVTPGGAAAESAQPKSGRSFFYVASLVLVLVLVGGWFLLSNWRELFDLGGIRRRHKADADDG